jgi:hypothetical protein
MDTTTPIPTSLKVVALLFIAVTLPVTVPIIMLPVKVNRRAFVNHHQIV